MSRELLRSETEVDGDSSVQLTLVDAVTVHRFDLSYLQALRVIAQLSGAVDRLGQWPCSACTHPRAAHAMVPDTACCVIRCKCPEHRP